MPKQKKYDAQRQPSNLGDTLLKARLKKHLSRAEVSSATGISENSLIRYEKCDREGNGQFPPADRLASLCFYLDINPLEAVLSCIPEGLYWKYEHKTFEDILFDHPDYLWLQNQYSKVAQDNDFMRAALEKLISPAEHDYDEEEKKWIKSELTQMFKRQEAFRSRMIALGIASPLDYGFMMPGKNQSFDELDYANNDTQVRPNYVTERVRARLQQLLQSLPPKKESPEGSETNPDSRKPTQSKGKDNDRESADE